MRTLYTYVYAAPIQRTARDVFDKWIRWLDPIIAERSVQRMYLRTLPFGENDGAEAYFLGMDSPTTNRSLRAHRVSVDEAKDVSEEGVWDVLVPFMLGREGGGLLLKGTPKRTGIGAAHFRKMFHLGLLPENQHRYASITAPSFGNPHLSVEQIEGMIQDARLRGGEDMVREEIYAEFLADSGAVFKNLDRVFVLVPIKVNDLHNPTLWIGEHPDKGVVGERRPDEYVIGVDVGIKWDSFVASVFNRRTRRQAALLRLTGVPAHVCRDRVKELRALYNGAYVVFDATGGYGLALSGDAAIHADSSYVPKAWERVAKERDIQRGSMLCERAGGDEERDGVGWYMLNVPWQRAEFQDYQMTTHSKGDNVALAHPKFGAPPGAQHHDDAVAAACLASEILSLPYAMRPAAPLPPPPLSPAWFEARQNRGTRSSGMATRPRYGFNRR